VTEKESKNAKFIETIFLGRKSIVHKESLYENDSEEELVNIPQSTDPSGRVESYFHKKHEVKGKKSRQKR